MRKRVNYELWYQHPGGNWGLYGECDDEHNTLRSIKAMKSRVSKYIRHIKIVKVTTSYEDVR
jgi:hypothetical protein